LSGRKITMMRRTLREAGVKAIAGRVWRRLKATYAAATRREKRDFLVLATLQVVSKEAFLAAWGRMSPSERKKFARQQEEVES